MTLLLVADRRRRRLRRRRRRPRPADRVRLAARPRRRRVARRCFTAGVLARTGRSGAIFAALWAIPLALGARGRSPSAGSARRRTPPRRQHLMRDALARLANAAWFVKDADALLLARPRRGPHRPGRPEHRGLAAAHRPRTGSSPSSSRPSKRRARRRRRGRSSIDLAQIVSAAAERYQLAERLHATAFADSLTRLPNRRSVERHLPTCSTAPTSSGPASRSSTATSTASSASTTRSATPAATRCSSGSPTTCAPPLHGDDAYVGRLGGDEFVVVARPGAADVDLVALARSLREGFLDRTSAAGPPALTVGVATWVPGDIVDADALSGTPTPRCSRPSARAPGSACSTARCAPRRGRRGSSAPRSRPPSTTGTSPPTSSRSSTPRRSRSSRSRRSPGGTTTAT